MSLSFCAFAGSLGWVWLSLHSKMQSENHSGTSSPYSTSAEQNRIWFLQCLLDPCTQPVQANVCTNISEGSFGWNNSWKDLTNNIYWPLHLSPFWPRALKPLADFVYKILWLWGQNQGDTWGEYLMRQMRKESMPFLPLTPAQGQSQVSWRNASSVLSPFPLLGPPTGPLPSAHRDPAHWLTKTETSHNPN